MEFKHGDVVVAQYRGGGSSGCIVIYPEKNQSLVLCGPWTEDEKDTAKLIWLDNRRLNATYAMDDDVVCVKCNTAMKRKDFAYKVFTPTKDNGCGVIIGFCNKCYKERETENETI